MDTKKLSKYLSYNYPIEISFISEENGGGVSARIPFLGRDAFVGDGDTVEEALENLNRLKKELFEDYLFRGIEIPPPPKDEDYSGKFVVRVPKFLHRELSERAKINDMSLNTFCVALLSQNLSLNVLNTSLNDLCLHVKVIRSSVSSYKYEEILKRDYGNPNNFALVG